MSSEFAQHGERLRIIGEARKDEFAAFGEARYNLLQMWHDWKGWVTVQEERIPDHAIISLGCFGDTGGWRSSLPAAGFVK